MISNFAIQHALNEYTTLSDAIGDAYEDSGHLFFILTFPNANATWCWDATAQGNGWHKRGTWDSIAYEFDAWRPLYHAFAFGEHRILDFQGSGVYRMSVDFATDVESLPIRRVRRAPAIIDENRLVFYSQFEVNLEPGLGLTSGQGSDPQIMMRISNDGGKTWGTETHVSAGALGEYGTRCIWNRCGAGRRRVFEISVTDPIPWRILGAFLKVKQAAEAA